MTPLPSRHSSQATSSGVFPDTPRQMWPTPPRIWFPLSLLTQLLGEGLCLPILSPTAQLKLETGSEKDMQERKVGMAGQTASALWGFRISDSRLLFEHHRGNCSQEHTQTAVTALSKGQRTPAAAASYLAVIVCQHNLENHQTLTTTPGRKRYRPCCTNEGKAFKILINWLKTASLKSDKAGFQPGALSHPECGLLTGRDLTQSYKQINPRNIYILT